MTTKLQAVRLSKGLTQADIVKRTGITQSTISQFEAGIRNFTNARVDTVVKIADALGVTDVRELLDGYGVQGDIIGGSTETDAETGETEMTKETMATGMANEAVTADDLKAMIDTLYPVGAVYMGFPEHDPNELFGGVWERMSGDDGMWKRIK